MWQELRWWRISWKCWGIFFFKVLFLGHSLMLGTFQIIVVTQVTAVWSILDIAPLYALRIYLPREHWEDDVHLHCQPWILFWILLRQDLYGCLCSSCFCSIKIPHPSPDGPEQETQRAAFGQKNLVSIFAFQRLHSRSWSWELSHLFWRSASFSIKTEWVGEILESCEQIKRGG